MADNLLYFPYIDIPQNSWTIKSILYWDKVGIIVPPNYIASPQQYEKFTIDLLQTDLVNQIFPRDYTRKATGFDEGFLKIVNQPKFNIEKRQINFKNGEYSRIHFQKFGDDILYHLVHLGIAKRQNWQWFYVERKTARLLMMYLAAIISKVGDFTPATDDLQNLDTSLSQKGYSLRLNSIRQNLIDDLIPYPIEPDLTKLRNFKDKFHEELTSFRVLLEQSAFDISTLKSKRLQSSKQKLVVAEINDKRQKILSDLNQSKFGQITFGTICGIAGAVVGFSQDNKPLALFSLANAVYSAFQGYDDKPILAQDYSYLALIDKKIKILTR